MILWSWPSPLVAAMATGCGLQSWLCTSCLGPVRSQTPWWHLHGGGGSDGGNGHSRRQSEDRRGRLLWAESRSVWAFSCDGQGLTLLCGPCSVGILWLASDTLLFRHNDLVWALKRNEASQMAWPVSVGPLLLTLVDSTASLSTAENTSWGLHAPRPEPVQPPSLAC